MDGRSWSRRALGVGVAAGSLLMAAPWALAGEHCLFVSDDEYFVIWVVDLDSRRTRHAFSLPEDAIGNTLPRGESGLAYDRSDLY
jgi:hypothetical protein